MQVNFTASCFQLHQLHYNCTEKFLFGEIADISLTKSSGSKATESLLVLLKLYILSVNHKSLDGTSLNTVNKLCILKGKCVWSTIQLGGQQETFLTLRSYRMGKNPKTESFISHSATPLRLWLDMSLLLLWWHWDYFFYQLWQVMRLSQNEKHRKRKQFLA